MAATEGSYSSPIAGLGGVFFADPDPLAPRWLFGIAYRVGRGLRLRCGFFDLCTFLGRGRLSPA